MEIVKEELAAISELLRVVKPAEAERKLLDLISRLDDESLALHHKMISGVVDEFLPKRRERLTQAIDLRVGPARPLPAQLLDYLRVELPRKLSDLSENYIFQWSAQYRDVITWLFDEVLSEAPRATDNTPLKDLVHTSIRNHATEIYAKGYEYQTGKGMAATAHQKSVAGLQRFLALPIEAYSERLTSIRTLAHAHVLRAITSSAICGILLGYGSVTYGRLKGWQLLPRYPRAWAHYIVFLEYADMTILVQALEPGEFHDGLTDNALPLIEGIEQFLHLNDLKSCPLPAIGQFSWDRRRLDISLSLPPTADRKKFLDIQCFLNGAFLARPELEEASSRDIDLVVGPFRPDVSEWAKGHDNLRSRIVDTRSGSVAKAVQRVVDIVRFQFASAADTHAEATPLTFNLAREFPLKNPFISQYFRVYRKSVRDLLRIYEGRNGLRIWCSVRRSGKSTACFDLGSSSGDSLVVNQTCDHTDEHQDAGIFYSEVDRYLRDERPLPSCFFMDAVEKCVMACAPGSSRIVFVLDEYETLFERLALSAQRNRELRYTIVQPLLNQIVAFSRANLVIFIGQRPDAHFIIMDQNQLSPYVEQDLFPLFPHSSGDTNSEFRELVHKVLTDRVLFDGGFLDQLFQETAGHPYLTVNVLVDLCDWMIAKGRRARGIQLREGDYIEFRHDRLTDQALLRSPEYEFFRKVIGDALSPYQRSQQPWLHFVYMMMRRISQECPEEMACDMEWIARVADELRTNEYGYEVHELVRTASRANFLQVTGNTVRPRIPLMGRLSRITLPRVT